LPKNAVGQLYIVGGTTEAANEILKVLTIRTAEKMESENKQKS